MIVQKELDRTQVTEIVLSLDSQNQIDQIATDLSNLTTVVDDLLISQTTQDNQLIDLDNRVTTLENLDYTTQLRDLTDVQMTLSNLEDGKIIYYNFSTDKFELKEDAGGIQDVVNNSQYVRTLNSWIDLNSADTIITINN